MKILIQNYTSVLTTEALYLNNCFSKINSVKSGIWDQNRSSVFDALDTFQPDVLLCGYNTNKLNDIIKYLNGNKNIDLIINISGIDQRSMSIIENMLEINSIKCPFFISNLHEKIFNIKPKNKVFNLLPAVDLFLQKQNLPDFNLEFGILSNSKELAEKIDTKNMPHHKLGIANTDKYFDINVSALNMVSLYQKYKKIIIAANLPVALSQFFFDSIFYSTNVSVKTDNQKLFNEILSDLFDQENQDTQEDIFSIIKKQIKNKHTCFNRSARLAQALKAENASKELLKIAEGL
jgi:hypothetical protein